MKITKSLLFVWLLAFNASAVAESKVTVCVDGETIAKDLTRMTFNDSFVTLTFSDNSTRTVEMNLVNISIDNHTDSSGLTEVKADTNNRSGIYNIKGQYLGDSTDALQPGIYIVNGKKVCIK